MPDDDRDIESPFLDQEADDEGIWVPRSHEAPAPDAESIDGDEGDFDDGGFGDGVDEFEELAEIEHELGDEGHLDTETDPQPDGEVVIVQSEVEEEKEETRPASSPVRARILWPALGFPAVIAPRRQARGYPMVDGDATKCVCVLLVSNRKFLSKEEAARYLRYVPWSQRGTRHIAAGAAGSFAEEELAVRNDAKEPALTMPGIKDRLAVRVAFGGNADGALGVTVTLAKRVREFYEDQGLRYLHEIRISEQTSGKLADGLYHLFWNNESTQETTPSDEMSLLLQKFARPRRASLGRLWTRFGSYLLREYAYEYGPLHPFLGKSMAKRRSEILHPLFVNRKLGKDLRINHLTDTHVSVRADAYERNLKLARGGTTFKGTYNNWNTNFVLGYNGAKHDGDVILMTGDLIDYGRGHWGRQVTLSLRKDTLYQVDRNWFLFQDLLGSGNAYQKPVYTILGNHDWRLNPYPPETSGAPAPKALIHDHDKLTADEQTRFVRLAHGPGWDTPMSYAFVRGRSAKRLEFWDKVWRVLKGAGAGKITKALVRLVANAKTMDVPGTPLQTTVESVAWYLFAINPFYDYSFALPSHHRVLMLDWAEDEDVLFPVVSRGQEFPYMLWQARTAAAPGPKANRSLTPLQKTLVEEFVGVRGLAKVIGIHAPPIGPYPDWYDTDLLMGKKVYKKIANARGPTDFATKTRGGKTVRWNGHPILAYPPKNGLAGMDCDYGSFTNEKKWFINATGNPRSGVRAVFAGHIHRKGLYVVQIQGKQTGVMAGERRVFGVIESAVRNARPPAVARVRVARRGPLYINTTSAGPRGNMKARALTKAEKEKWDRVDPGYTHLVLSSGGTIRKVEFRDIPRALLPGVTLSPKVGTSREAELVGAHPDDEGLEAAFVGEDDATGAELEAEVHALDELDSPDEEQDDGDDIASIIEDDEPENDDRELEDDPEEYEPVG
jgi:hypothetical protein